LKTVAIIQARMGSTRLPGKVLMNLAGMPALAWVTRAAQATSTIDEVWIATSSKSDDDAVADSARHHGAASYRGSELDVLDRYAGAAKASAAQIVVRLTADCPFLDPEVVEATVQLQARSGAAYVSNVDPRSWPRGLDCEVLTAEALFVAAAEAAQPFDREHVTPFLRNNRQRFPAENLLAPLAGLTEERWTLDTPADYAFLSMVAERLPSGQPPSYREVLAILDREPNLRAVNRIPRSEGVVA
jgi:spore coat polysaccharide biosynthesis protein SpsF (cytidylyltransferase family)